MLHAVVQVPLFYCQRSCVMISYVKITWDKVFSNSKMSLYMETPLTVIFMSCNQSKSDWFNQIVLRNYKECGWWAPVAAIKQIPNLVQINCTAIVECRIVFFSAIHFNSFWNLLKNDNIWKRLILGINPSQRYNRTRMHSSRMRTGRSLTVCCSLHPGGGSPCRGGVPGRGGGGGVPGPGGFSLPGGGVCLVPGGGGSPETPPLTESQTRVKT